MILKFGSKWCCKNCKKEFDMINIVMRQRGVVSCKTYRVLP